MVVVLQSSQVTRARRVDSDRGIVPALHVAIRGLLMTTMLGALVVLRVPVAPWLRSDESSKSIHPSATGHTGHTGQGRIVARGDLLLERCARALRDAAVDLTVPAEAADAARIVAELAAVAVSTLRIAERRVALELRALLAARQLVEVFTLGRWLLWVAAPRAWIARRRVRDPDARVAPASPAPAFAFPPAAGRRRMGCLLAGVLRAAVVAVVLQ